MGFASPRADPVMTTALPSRARARPPDGTRVGMDGLSAAALAMEPLLFAGGD
jgi:hypothetical protein